MIEVIELKGTNSIASDRITINDNFSIVTNATNSLLGIIDITTGKIDISQIGSDNTIVTAGITVTGSSGLDLTAGNISLDAGSISLNGDLTSISMGTQGASIVHKFLTNASSLVEYDAADLSTFKVLGLPSMVSNDYLAIDPTELVGGEIAYDQTLGAIFLYNGTSWVQLATQ